MIDFAKRATVGSDEEILRLVHQALCGCGYAQIENLDVYCDNGRVTLQGRLPTSFLKEMAHSVIHSVAGVRDIDNDVNVNSH